MRKLRNILRVGLFITGITLQFASFGVSQVEQAPWVLNIVSPKSVSGMAGVAILTKEKPLEQNDKGFREISDIVKTRLKKFYPNKDRDEVDVIRYVTEGKKALQVWGLTLVVLLFAFSSRITRKGRYVLMNWPPNSRRCARGVSFTGVWVCLLLV